MSGSKQKNYRGGRLIDVLEVRAELYDLWNRVQGWKNNHLADRDLPQGHDPRMYHVCQARAGEQSGIVYAIRRFGGAPRRVALTSRCATKPLKLMLRGFP